MEYKLLILAKQLHLCNYVAESNLVLKLAQDLLSKEEEEELSWEEYRQILDQQKQEQKTEKEILLEQGWGMSDKPQAEVQLPSPIQPQDTSWHFDWLADGENLRSIAAAEDWGMTWEQSLDKIIGQNKDFFDNIVSQHSGAKPKYLGSGGYGDAWQLGDDTILKLYRTYSNAGNYNFPLKFLYDGASFSELAIHEPMIHQEGIIHTPEEQMISWVVMEKLINIEEIKQKYKIPVFFMSALFSLAGSTARAITTRSFSYLNSHPLRFPDEDFKKYSHELARLERETADVFKLSGEASKVLSGLTGQLDLSLEEVISRLKHLTAKIEVAARELFETNYKVGEAEEILNLNPSWFRMLVEQCIVKILTHRMDLSPLNVGLRETSGAHPKFDDNYFVFFDY